MKANLRAVILSTSFISASFANMILSPARIDSIQDTIFIYNSGTYILILLPIPHFGSAPDMGANEYNPTVGIPTRFENLIPKVYSFYKNYPNPFNPSTTIEFDLPKTGEMSLKIFIILVEEVARLVSEKLTAGIYKYEWNASRFASDVYYYKVEAGFFIQTKKLILLK